MHKLVLDNVSKSFDASNAAGLGLHHLSLTFPAGQMCCINGPSGSGKTTLLSILSLLVSPDSGQVLFDDEDLFAFPADERERFRTSNIGMIFQSLRLVEVFNVDDHVRQAARHDRSGQMVADGERLLRELSMEHKKGAFPHELSGGEKQRAALAIALCRSPRIVLADEPTAALDDANSRVVAEALRAYAESGAVVVCVSHDPIVFERAHVIEQLRKTNEAAEVMDGQFVDKLASTVRD